MTGHRLWMGNVSRALMVLSIAYTLGCAPAFAQIISQSVLPQPAERTTLDKNNVEVTSGAISLSIPELSIGSQAFGLSLTQFYDSRTGWRDSFVGTLDFHSWGYGYDHNSYTASWGNQSWAFGSGVDHSLNGAVLQPIDYDHYQVITRDGTVISYANLLLQAACGGDEAFADCTGTLHATRIEYPNGVVVTPHYRVYVGSSVFYSQVRVQSVTSNLGYQIKFTYQSNSISDAASSRQPWLTRTSAVAVNNAVEYCDPDADACSLSGNWPTVVYASATGTHTVTDPLGRATAYTYTGGPTSVRIRTAGSSTDNVQYTLGAYNDWFGNPFWRVSSVTLGSSTWSYAYSPAPQYTLTTSVTDPQSGQTVFTATKYDFNDAYSSQWSAWALTSTKDPLNRTTSFSYPCGPSYGVLNVQAYVATSPEGNVSTPTCDSRGNVTYRTQQPKANSGLANIVTHSTFPAAAFPVSCSNYKTCNKPLSTFDGRVSETVYTYDGAHGGVLTETSPAVNGVSAQERYTYQQFSSYAKNASGTLVPTSGSVWMPVRVAECRTSNYSTTTLTCAAGAADETVTTFEYGAAGATNRLLVRAKVVTSGGVSLRTCYAYDRIGNQIAVTSPRAGLSVCPEAPASYAFTTSYLFDAARQLVGTISPLGIGSYEAVRNTHDLEGHIIKIERGTLTSPSNWSAFVPLEVTDRTYDVMGRLLTAKRSSSAGVNPALVQYSYDSLGRRECTAIRMNAAVYGSLPASACALSTQGAAGPDRITRLVYDAAGQVTIEKRAYGTSLQQDYATYAYTLNGRQDWVEDANGNRSDFTYDGFDRVSRLDLPSATLGAHAVSGSDYELYGYDANSNRTSLRLRSGETIAFQFDALNRLSVKDFPGTASGDVYYGYTLQGRNVLARFGSPTGLGVTNVYDGFGRMTSTTSSSSSDSLQLSYLYDEDGNRTRVTWPDNNYVQYTYDGLERMDQVRENGMSSGPGLLVDYSYDSLGRRSNIARGNGTVTMFYYDGISRLSNLVQDLVSTSGDVTFGFGYNNAHQIVQRDISNDSYAYFALPKSQSYMRDGLSRYTSVGGVSYGYDLRGNLTSDGSRSFSYDLENHLLSVSGSSSVGLSYDPTGRLLTSTSGGKTTRYLYDGDRMVAEYDGATLLRRYAHGANPDEPLVWYEGTNLNDRRWLHTDHQGSVVSTSDSTGFGTLYAYGAYGEPAYDNWRGARFRFTGQMMLPDAKLYHYKARVYDPMLGRFLQTDPVGYQDDFNLYGYVGNDPLNRTDPMGTYSCGVSLSEGQCEAVSKAQDAAKKTITQAIAAIKGIQQTIAAGGTLDATQQKVSDVVSKMFGKGAGTDGKVLSSLVGAGEKMLGALNSKIPAEYGGKSTDYALTDPGNKVTLYDSHFSSSPLQQAETMGHEAAHEGARAVDLPRLGQGYGKEPVAQLGPSMISSAAPRYGTGRMLEIAEALALGLGLTRDDAFK